ncbi:hypothetical protein L3X38_031700 [Prunus dulcis]|uniref:Uncharacterized protein n=1 Tax=Prunus dulcis TaxID=3755 RepID=A0AAD4YVW0_PRUDU|nr:hypothetical protein L3X38_031700 [Prunus dulcis]
MFPSLHVPSSSSATSSLGFGGREISSGDCVQEVMAGVGSPVRFGGGLRLRLRWSLGRRKYRRRGRAHEKVAGKDLGWVVAEVGMGVGEKKIQRKREST